MRNACWCYSLQCTRKDLGKHVVGNGNPNYSHSCLIRLNGCLVQIQSTRSFLAHRTSVTVTESCPFFRSISMAVLQMSCCSAHPQQRIITDTTYSGGSVLGSFPTYKRLKAPKSCAQIHALNARSFQQILACCRRKAETEPHPDSVNIELTTTNVGPAPHPQKLAKFE